MFSIPETFFFLHANSKVEETDSFIGQLGF